VIGRWGTRLTLGRSEAGGTFGEMALMTGDPMLADIVAESPTEVLLVPVSLFQSVIVAQPGAVQHISRTIADRFKTLVADPSTATAALAQSPTLRAEAQGRAAGEDPRRQLRVVVAQVRASTTPRTRRATRAARWSASASPDPPRPPRSARRDEAELPQGGFARGLRRHGRRRSRRKRAA
jgi:acetate kinase